MYESPHSALLISSYNAEPVPSTEYLTSDQFFHSSIFVASYVFTFVFFDNTLRFL